jgi:hypothetical protein
VTGGSIGRQVRQLLLDGLRLPVLEELLLERLGAVLLLKCLLRSPTFLY